MKFNPKPIEELIQEYEEEMCDFSNIPWCVSIALKYVERMEDSQVRCLLYTLAKELEEKE